MRIEIWHNNCSYYETSCSVHLKTTLVLLCLASLVMLFSNCRKTSTQQWYTSKMGGMRNWTGSYLYQASGIHFPTPINEFYYHPDTSFAVLVVDNSTIQFMNSVFTYEQTDTARQIYYFGTAYLYYQYNVGTGVAYYYAKDSIVYCDGDVHGTSDSWVLRNLYYSY